jgi:hypothetical protein
MVDVKEEPGKRTTTLIIEVIAGLMSAAFAFVVHWLGTPPLRRQ